MVIDQSQLKVAKMKAKIHEKNGAFVQPNSHLSYVLSITLPQPTIRIRIPKVLVKAIQRRNQTRSENGENGALNNKKQQLDTSRKKSFRKKVGSMVSNVFGKKKKSSNGDDEDMKKLKKMIESIDMGSEKMTGKNSEEECVLNDGVMQQMDVVMVEAEDEGKDKEEPPQIATEEGENERKERPKSRRTYSKHSSKMEQNKGKTNNVDNDNNNNNNNTEITVVYIDDEGGNNNSIGTKDVVSVKQAGFGSKTVSSCSSSSSSSGRKPKIALSMKKISDIVGTKSEKRELCKKRILMGVRCRPLNHSGVIQYDENGVLIPEINP